MILLDEEAEELGHMAATVEFVAPDGSTTVVCACDECRVVAGMFDAAEAMCKEDREEITFAVGNESDTKMHPRDAVDRMITDAWAAFMYVGVDSACMFLRFALKHRMARWGTEGLSFDFLKMSEGEAVLHRACGSTN